MRIYAARFEKMAYSLGLSSSRALIAQFVSSIPDPLATHLQLHSISNPSATFSDIIRTAISLESSSTVSQRPSGDQRSGEHHFISRPRGPFCTNHGYVGHATADCRNTVSNRLSQNQPATKTALSVPSPPPAAAVKTIPASSPANTCFNCKKAGHLANDCPEPRTPSTRWCGCRCRCF